MAGGRASPRAAELEWSLIRASRRACADFDRSKHGAVSCACSRLTGTVRPTNPVYPVWASRRNWPMIRTRTARSPDRVPAGVFAADSDEGKVFQTLERVGGVFSRPWKFLGRNFRGHGVSRLSSTRRPTTRCPFALSPVALSPNSLCVNTSAHGKAGLRVPGTTCGWTMCEWTKCLRVASVATWLANPCPFIRVLREIRGSPLWLRLC